MRKLFAIMACAVTLSATASAQEYVLSPMFQGYATAGTVFFGGGREVKWGTDFNASFGARLDDYTYIGVESGLAVIDSYTVQTYLIDESVTSAYVPIACNFRLMYPVSTRFVPYINVSVGGFIGVFDLHRNGFYLQLGAGIDYKRFTFGVGYTGLGDHGFANAGYLKVGVKFGGKTW